MKILFIHQKFPSQYKHLAPALAADPSNQVVAMQMQPDAPSFPGIQTVYTPLNRINTPGIHPWLIETETKAIRGEASWHTAKALRKEGFMPDVICAHPGWGEALFVKDVWPDSALLSFFEFYYHAKGYDVGFDPEFPSAEDESCCIRMKNINNLLALEACDAGISPTRFQKSLHPPEFHHKISILHDGIDTNMVLPNKYASILLKNEGITLTRQDEVITFVNRNLEPYRGWHIFARALPGILANRPNAHLLIVGGDGVSYGRVPDDYVSYKQRYLAEVVDRIDMNRVHFVGHVDYSSFLTILQISSAHVYLTYPFVLSWSMLEAMSAGCLVIGSRTAPVEEVIQHGKNGLLVDFFSTDELTAAIDEVFSHRDRMQAVRDQARTSILEQYDLRSIALPRQIALVQKLAKRISQ